MKLSHRLRQLAATRHAPPELKERILAALDAEDRANSKVVPIASRIRWRLVGGGVLAAAAAAIILTISRPDVAASLVQEHLRALTPDGAYEGSDLVAAANWLESQIGYPVDIPDIAEARLTGARVATIGSVRAAAVVYQLHGQRLTYLAMPEDTPPIESDDVTTMASSGYHVAVWTESGGPRAVVAAMSEDEIAAVAEECKRKAAMLVL